jgi:hypothetical protein
MPAPSLHPVPSVLTIVRSTTAAPIATRVGYLLLGLADATVRRTCKALAKVSPIVDGGVFHEPGGSSFWDCWRERSARGGAVTLRLGRIEVIADYRRRATGDALGGAA